MEAGAELLVPVKLSRGVLVIGERTITHYSGAAHVTVPIDFSTFKAVGAVDPDGGRLLLGDHLGRLFVLVVEHERGSVTRLALERLGVTSQPSSLTYVDEGVVFLGSSFGNSQLVRLLTEPADDGTYLQTLASYENLGPIVDFVVVDLERQGQGQVVTCSGAHKDGSLRVVRNGIGIHEQARVELPGIKGMWSLRNAAAGAAAADGARFLVLSFISETRVLAMQDDDEIGEVELPGFDAECATLHCSDFGNGAVVQVTTRGARLLDASTMALASEWAPADGASISLACADGERLLVATAGRKLVMLTVTGGAWTVAAEATMAHEVACIALAPQAAGGSSAMETDAAAPLPPMAAAGLWTDLTVRLLSVGLEEVGCEALGGEVIPRSLLFASFEGASRHYLLCALGDGKLVSFALDLTGAGGGEAVALGERKVAALGTQPLSLVGFECQGSPHVFASSDRPAVVHSANGKLLYASVNIKEVAHMAPFASAAFPECLAIASDDALLIGTIDAVQKLHMRTVSLGEQPRRLAHLEGAHAFALLTTRLTPAADGEGEDDEVAFVRLLDDQSFERLAELQLQPKEMCISVAYVTLAAADLAAPVLVVGTAYTHDDEPEPSSGRILVLDVHDRTFELKAEVPVRGAVYSLEPFNGMLVAGVNNKLQLYGWAPPAAGSPAHLALRHEHCGHILVLYIASRGDFILVGDLMKSLSLLQYSADGHKITELARDYSANWMTAIAFLDDDTFLGAENHCNLFTARKRADAATDDERKTLETVGEFHLGEFVNRFRRGSISMQVAENGAAPLPTLLYGSVNGTLGVIAALPEELFERLGKLQASLAKVVKGVGGFSHADWRAFCNDRKKVEMRGFIDGDLIEAFAELPPAQKAEVAAEVGDGVDELTKLVEELTRLH